MTPTLFPKTIHRIVLLAVALFLTATFPAVAERGDDTDRKSKNGKAMGTLDGVDVTVEYGRPNVKERTLWGGLVPYDKVWRTGADEATTITFSGDVTVEGEALAAGTYGLFTIPTEGGGWTIIFNTVAEQWGTSKYDEANDALRVEVQAQDSEDHVEEMTFTVGDGTVSLHWGTTVVPVSVASGG